MKKRTGKSLGLQPNPKAMASYSSNLNLKGFGKDSFITHRAFCDALAEESSRFVSAPPDAATYLNNASDVEVNHKYSYLSYEESKGIRCSVTLNGEEVSYREMGCFISREDDPYKADLKTAKLISRFDEENRKAQAEIDLSKKKEETRSERQKQKGKRKQEEDDDDQEDKQLPKTNKETFKDEGQRMNLPRVAAASTRDRGNSVNPQGVCCQICLGPFALDEIPKKGKYHKRCYEDRSICYVCTRKFPLTKNGREFKEHEFWKDKHCPGHENDGTPKCCSCERLEPKGKDYVMLEDYRMLCLDCIESSVMDSSESYTLHLNVRGFFDDLDLKIEKEILPILLVDKPALNEAETEEKIDHRNAAITRGLCLSEEQFVRSIKQPRIEPNNPVQSYMDMVKERIWVSGCQVTGILILYGLPRLQTGYIMVHEMMHAWLRLNGYRNLKLKLEEGFCQAISLRWLESLGFGSTDHADAASSSSSSSHSTAATSTSKKGDPWSDFEKRLVQFCIYQIKEDESKIYGQGFKEVYKMMQSNGNSIKDTLEEIVSVSNTR